MLKPVIKSRCCGDQVIYKRVNNTIAPICHNCEFKCTPMIDLENRVDTRLIRSITTVAMIIGLFLVIFSSLMLTRDLKQATKGDLNLDGRVDLLDLSLMATHLEAK